MKEKESDFLRSRREKIESLKAEGVELYPNDVKVSDTAGGILARLGGLDSEALGRLRKRGFCQPPGPDRSDTGLLAEGPPRRKDLFTLQEAGCRGYRLRRRQGLPDSDKRVDYRRR